MENLIATFNLILIVILTILIYVLISKINNLKKIISNYDTREIISLISYLNDRISPLINKVITTDIIEQLKRKNNILSTKLKKAEEVFNKKQKEKEELINQLNEELSDLNIRNLITRSQNAEFELKEIERNFKNSPKKKVVKTKK